MMNWLIHTNAGLATRILAGAIIFLCLAISDLKKRGSQATRWREYLFLLVVVVASIVYGVLNDQITSRISWEYFYYGKELGHVLGPEVPPDRAAMGWQAAKIGAMATWSAGLFIGVSLLIANNPSQRWPRLNYRELLKTLPAIFAITIIFAVILGWIGWHGGLNWMSEDFRLMFETNIFRPQHFLATYGVHLGGYVGGLIGTIVAVCWIVVKRKRLAGEDVTFADFDTTRPSP
jgi:hypothetical protein